MENYQSVTTARIGLIMGGEFDEVHHDLIDKLKAKHGISVFLALEGRPKTRFLPPRMLSIFNLLVRKYDVVIVLSGYRLRVSDFLRRLLGLLVRAPVKKVCRLTGQETELSWSLWFRSLVRYFLLFQKVQTARLLAYSLPILCFFALKSSSTSRKE